MMRVLPFARRPLSYAADVAVSALTTSIRTLASLRTRATLHQRLTLRATTDASTVFVNTYPRSGTTWAQMIVHQLLTKGDDEFRHIEDVCPTLEQILEMELFHTVKEAVGTSVNVPCRWPVVKQSAHPFIAFKTHLPYRRIRPFPGKVLYVARDGRDVFVSGFHFASRWQRPDRDEYFQMFLRGELPFGSWFAHVADAMDKASDPNLLLLRFEELSADLRGSVRRISDFLELRRSDEELDALLPRCEFAFMKEHERQFEPGGRSPAHAPFIRKGTCGQWRDYLTPAEDAQFRERLCAFIGAERAATFLGDAAVN